MKRYKSALQMIERWPNLVYPDDGFPNVLAFCRFYILANEQEIKAVMLELNTLSADALRANNEVDVHGIREFKTRYKKLMRYIENYAGGAS